MSDRRFGDRAESNGEIVLEISTNDGVNIRLGCVLINYSDGGVGIRTDHPLPLALKVRVIAGEDQYEGKVRYCERNPSGGYLVGVKFATA